MLASAAMTDLTAILRDSRTVAVLGAHPDTGRPAFYVPDYLYRQGYRILPVNPTQVGTVLWGVPTVARLTDLNDTFGPVDLVDVFRRADALPGHLDEFLAMRPLPPVFWFQSGVRHDGVAARLTEAGVTVVQDRCTLAEHRARRLPPHPPAS